MIPKRPTITVKKPVAKAPAPRKPQGVQKADTPRARRPAQPTPQPELKVDSLAFALLGAARAVALVKGGMALPQALAQVFAHMRTTPQARGAIQDIAYRTMRQLGMAEALLATLASKAPEPPLLHGLLCCALSLLLPAGGGADDRGYEAFTLVDQAVSAGASDSATVQAKGMVNAVLRRYLRERDVLLAEALANPVALWNYPQWWIDAMRAAYPQSWQAILLTGNEHPPLTLRVNRRRSSVEDYLRTLADAGMEATQIGPSAIRLSRAVPVERLPGFASGWVSVQDAGAQIAAPLLDLHDGMRVLDACAAPGGKTGHILESANVDLLALDEDAERLVRVTENLGRLQLDAQVAVGDASGDQWWDGQLFDRILADVPCTASGIVRRHPDIRWLRRKDDARRLATLSAQILDNLWRMLRPGGKLLFVTCSVWPLESEAQAAAFAVRQRAQRLAAPGQLLPAAGESEDHDGLFYALFQKPAS